MLPKFLQQTIMSNNRLGLKAQIFFRELPLFLKDPVTATYYLNLCKKYRKYTMLANSVYIHNLRISKQVADVPGCIVECGVWRGGTIAGIADVLGSARKYFLFDSFEGLPPAKEEVDGESAVSWQNNPASFNYNDNCTADISFAQEAMEISKAKEYELVKGWFEDTIPKFKPPEEIALLRLDGDWFDSTLVCLENLYPYLAKKAIIIVDDYYQWDGCSRAVHHFLAKNNLGWRITQWYGTVCVIQIR